MQIETERLILREYQSEDWEAIHQYASREDILEYEVWGPNTVEQTKAFVAKVLDDQQTQPRRSFEFCITLKTTGQLIGGCGTRLNKDQANQSDLGYIINQDYWNRGYATEAAQALTQYFLAHKGIKRIEATCDAENIASQKVLEKIGFTLMPDKKKAMKIKGKMRDMLYFELQE